LFHKLEKLNFDFESTDLCKLYETGKNQKLTLPQEVIEKFMLRVECICAANDLKDIKNDIVVDFKRIKNKNQVSLRLLDGWRMEVDLIHNGSPNKIEKILIKRILQTSN